MKPIDRQSSPEPQEQPVPLEPLPIEDREPAADVRADSAVLQELAEVSTARDPGLDLECRQRLSEMFDTLSVLCHKINNPLTSLLGRAQLLQARPDADPAVVKAASVIKESATRVAELVRELAGVVKKARREALGESSGLARSGKGP